MFSVYIPQKMTIRSLTIGFIVVTSVSLTKYGYFISFLGLTTAALQTFLSYTCDYLKETILSTWLALLKQLCHICVAVNGISVLMDYMNGNKKNYIHLVPTTTMPHLLPITIIAVITILIILGLEANNILDSLLNLFLSLGFVIFIITGITLVYVPKTDNIKIPEDTLLQVFTTSTLFSACFDYNKGVAKVRTLLESILKFTIFGVVVIILFFLPPSECTMISIVCPISHWYTWYEPIMVSVALSSLCLALLEIFMPALDTLVMTKQFQIKMITKQNATTGTHIRAICSIGVVCSILLYVHSTYSLIVLSSCCVFLGQIFDIIIPLNEQYQPSFIEKETGKENKKGEVYLTLQESLDSYNTRNDDTTDLETCFSDDSGNSSETDIDYIVSEYKHSIKLKSFNLKIVKREPTFYTGQAATVLIIVIVLCGILCFIAIEKKYYIASICILIGALFLTLLLHVLPQRNDSNKIKFSCLLGQMVYILFNIICISTIIMDIGVTLVIWILGGIIWIAGNSNAIHLKKMKKPKLRLQSPPGPFIITDTFPVQKHYAV